MISTTNAPLCKNLIYRPVSSLPEISKIFKGKARKNLPLTEKTFPGIMEGKEKRAAMPRFGRKYHMELIAFQPLPDSGASVAGYLHTPIWEMEVRREQFPAVVICPGGAYAMVSEREAAPSGAFRNPAGHSLPQGMAGRPGPHCGVRLFRRRSPGLLPGNHVGRPGAFEGL